MAAAVDRAAFAAELDALERAMAAESWQEVERRALRLLERETGLGLAYPDAFAATREALGTAYVKLGRVSDAARQFSRALRHRPSARGYAGLARAIWQQGDPVAQLALIEQALKLDPENPVYLVTRGELRLTTGAWAAGFADCEQRLTYRPFDVIEGTPLWDGDDLAGRSIFVAREGGHGDAFMFARYLPMLEARGAGRVIWHTWPTVAAFLRGRVPGPVGIVPFAVKGDCWVPLMSLPQRFGTTEDAIPGPVPLFGPPPVPHWPPQRVGLVWSGGPGTGSDPIRSIGIEALRPLIVRFPEITWVSLQYPMPKTPPAWTAGRLVWPELHAEWAETAMALRHVDLLVTVDTAIGHLAATMGLPTWVLLAHPTDWRWLLRRAHTAWYPSMRLFRQETPRDWHGVVWAVGQALNP